MATRKIKNNEVEIEKASEIDSPERFRLGSIGYSGLKIFDGIVESEMVKELKYPESNKTFKKMMLHPAVNSSVGLHKSMIGKAIYRIEEPANSSTEEKQQTDIIRQMLFEDMEVSFQSVISQAMTMIDYGFAPLEIIFRRRTNASGSLYDDGLIGLRRLSLRHQESIEKFEWDDRGEYPTAIVQNISLLSDPYNRFNLTGNTKKVIPITKNDKNKILLFTAGDNKDNPYGTSPLRNVYLPLRFLQAIEELESSGVAKDLQGLPVLSIPAQYMSKDASPEQQQFFLWAQNIVRNIQMNSQSGLVLPQVYDPETRQPLFKMELLSTEGKKNYDTTKIKEYYRQMIFVGLSADVLMQGVGSVGSYAIGSLKTTLTGQAVENYLKHIIDVFNNQLIRQVYELNAWDATRRCKLDYDGFEDIQIDEYSKAIQRMAATGVLPKTLDVINSNLRMLGIDELPQDTNKEELESMLGDMTSRSGDGLESGMNSGTGGADGSSGNASDLNGENAA